MTECVSMPGYPHPMGTLKRPGTGHAHDLTGRCLVGRAVGSDLRIPSPGVSSQHATLRWDESRWLLRDLGSRNGTTVDDRPITAGEDVPIGEGCVIRFGDDAQGWALAEAGPPTGTLAGSQTRRGGGSTNRLTDAELAFRVSRDEEHCELIVRLGTLVHDLGARAHHYTLLTLARQRVDDIARGDLQPEEEGWLYTNDLADMLGLDIGALNVQIYRARKAFEKLGLEGAADLVERRPSTGQLRLGPSRLRISRAGEIS